MKLKTLLLLIVSIFLWSSCSEPCPPDITLGEFPLSDKSKEFVPYNGLDTLVFTDQNDSLYFLSLQDSVQLIETNTIVRTICSDGLTEGQQELYNTQRIEVAYADTSVNLNFSLNLATLPVIGESPDDNVIFDLLNVSANGFDAIKILTDERQNQLSEDYESTFLKLSDFLGDTTLFEKDFKEVYEQQSDNGRAMYFNKHKGVVALKFNETDYLVLED